MMFNSFKHCYESKAARIYRGIAPGIVLKIRMACFINVDEKQTSKHILIIDKDQDW